MEKTVLLIGGGSDGKRVDVTDPTPTFISMPVLDWVDERCNMRIEQYWIQRFWNGNDEYVEVYVLNGIPTEQIIHLLIKGYKGQA
jgi:hypothetical protein